MKRSLCALYLALFSALFPAFARAATEDEHTVLLAAAPSQSELLERLRTELTLGGWLVVEMPDGDEGPPRVPDEVARHVRASVAMRVDVRGDVELWVLDPETSATVYHESIDTDPSQGVDVVTLRVVEVLRARLLKLGVPLPKPPQSGSTEPRTSPSVETPAAPPNAPEVQRPEPVAVLPAPAADRGPRVELRREARETRTVDIFAAPLAAWSPGGLGWTADIAFGAHYAPFRNWAFGASMALPVASASVTEPQGTVTVRWGHLGAVVERRFTSEAGGGFSVGAFAGVIAEHLSGEATPPYRSASDWIETAAFLGTLGAHFELSKAVRIRLEGSGGLAAPRPAVVVADRTVAVWGRPLLLLSLGIEWDVWHGQ